MRAQYNRRNPENALLGTLEAPVAWHGLPLPKKIETIHTACEWQLVDAERFRKLVKNDEEAHVWRIDPIGWDGQDNTYWLFDDNRLWVQHPPPPPPPKPKAKGPPKKSSKKAKAEARRAAKRKREGAASKTPAPTRPRSSLRGRQSSASEPAAKRPRSSRGEKGAADESVADTTMNGDDGDDSDLSEPPSEDEFDTTVADDDAAAEEIKKEEAGNEEGHEANSEIDSTPAITKSEIGEAANGSDAPVEQQNESWVEFEAIAVERVEWEWMATRFAKSRHPDEKALHVLLRETVLPKVMADIAEAEKQQAHEAAMANRKRSSRIALKESEREERERDRVARIKMEEKMAAIREEEENKERKEREEQDAARVREERLREREERALAREREIYERAEKESFEREQRERMREVRKLRREQGLPENPEEEEDGTNTPANNDAGGDDNWELNCEVCGRRGFNLDDTDEIVCCETCGVWQHTECWNAFDRSVSRARRDWENEDFFCSKCRPPAPGQPWPRRPKAAQGAPLQANKEAAKLPQAHGTHPPSVPVVPSQGSPAHSAILAPLAPQQDYSAPSRQSASTHIGQDIPRGLSMQGSPAAPQHAQYGFIPQSSAQPIRLLGPNASQMQSLDDGYGQMRPPNVPQSQMQQPLGTDTQRPLPHAQPQSQPQSQQQSEQVRQAQPKSTPSIASPVRDGPRSVAASSQISHHSGLAPSANGKAAPSDSVSAQKPSPSSLATQSGSASPSANGHVAVAQPTSPTLARKVSSSPTGAALPMRSPQSSSAAATSSVPRHMANQPSGSFPMRHVTARSPLSGPHTASPTTMPPMSIGPPLQRAGSPSPIGRGTESSATPVPGSNGSSSASSSLGPARSTGQGQSEPHTVDARPSQLGQELLHSRQAPTPAPTPNASRADTHEASVSPAAAGSAIPASSAGPGPFSGSLARKDSLSAATPVPAASTGAPNVTTPSPVVAPSSAATQQPAEARLPPPPFVPPTTQS